MSNKVVIVGLDGGAFSTLQPWMDAGHLPNLQRMIQTGVSGDLQSVIPPVTAPAWVSFMTGKNPGKHGVYYFTTRDKTTGREVPVSASSRVGKTLWELLSDSDKTVLVLNVPTTYPPTPVNGVLIADFLTPKGKRDFVYPTALLDEIENRFGPYPLYLKTPVFAANLSESNVESFLAELYLELRYKMAVMHYLMDRYTPDFSMVHLWGTDRAQHELWNLFDADHPRYNAKLAARCQPKIIQYFSAVDAALGQLQQRLDEQTTLIVMSDHGFGPIHRFIDLNVWLLQHGFIAIKPTLLSQLRLWAWKLGITNELFLKLLLGLVKLGIRLPDRTPADAVNLVREDGFQPLLSLNDVDWSKTKAYAKFGLGQIVINLAGRDAKGSVQPGAEYQQVRDEIVQRLKTLRDPDTGQLIGGEIYIKEDAYHGEFLDEAPDITFLPLDNNYMANILVGFSTRRWIMDIPALFGNHRLNGIFIAQGKHLAKGRRLDGARIIDVAPTVLYLMGQKIPTDMDGAVLTEAFTEEFLNHQPIEWTEPSRSVTATAPSLTQEDEATIIERLKGLGYL